MEMFLFAMGVLLGTLTSLLSALGQILVVSFKLFTGVLIISWGIFAFLAVAGIIFLLVENLLTKKSREDRG